KHARPFSVWIQDSLPGPRLPVDGREVPASRNLHAIAGMFMSKLLLRIRMVTGSLSVSDDAAAKSSCGYGKSALPLTRVVRIFGAKQVTAGGCCLAAAFCSAAAIPTPAQPRATAATTTHRCHYHRAVGLFDPLKT